MEGVEIRLAQYDDLSSLRLTFEGIEKLFFVSSNTFDSEKRTKQHENVVQAAKETKVQHIFYSSLAFGGLGSNSKVDVQKAHLATEDLLEKSGLTYTSVREGIYAEAFPPFLNWYPSITDLFLPADGPVAWAFRKELGEATARLMLKGGYENRKVLLTGPKAYTMQAVVETINKTTHRNVALHYVSLEEYVARNADNDEGKKPKAFFDAWKSAYVGIANGDGACIDQLMGELLRQAPTDGLKLIEGLSTEDRDYRQEVTNKSDVEYHQWVQEAIRQTNPRDEHSQPHADSLTFPKKKMNLLA
ncbi:MAG: hypothetical protein Q9167_005686 [Letrouitia subvulpina]